jgi:pimeloyl-ACP methyl ester carboxylesterase
MPLTILMGMDDRLMPMENSKNLANAIPDARLVLVLGCEHGVQVQCQDLVIQEIENGCR